MQDESIHISRRSLIGGALALSAASCLSMPNLAFATPTAAEKKAEAEAALASLNAMQETLNKASDDYFTALEERDAARAKMDEAQELIDAASDEIAVIQDKLGTRASSMYRSGNTTFIDLLLGSTSFSEFATNWDILNKMNQNDADMVQETKDLRAMIEEQKEEYAAQEKIASEKTEEALAIKEEAEATTAAMQATYDSLSAEAAELLEQERAAAEAAAAAAAAAEEANRQQQSRPSGGGPTYNPITGNAVVDRAYGCLGLPYVWGACGPSSFDCSGLVSYCLTGSFSRLGTTYTFMAWPEVSDPQPGDVAVNWTHTGIYIGGGQMIHASGVGVGVVQGSVPSSMKYVRY